MLYRHFDHIHLVSGLSYHTWWCTILIGLKISLSTYWNAQCEGICLCASKGYCTLLTYLNVWIVRGLLLHILSMMYSLLTEDFQLPSLTKWESELGRTCTKVQQNPQFVRKYMRKISKSFPGGIIPHLSYIDISRTPLINAGNIRENPGQCCMSFGPVLNSGVSRKEVRNIDRL